MEPLVVRPHPEKEDDYQILGGEHRWRICKEELGYERVPCVLLDLDDRRAQILSVNLNSMTGETVSSRLSQVLNDLNAEMPIEDMEALLPYDTREIQDTLALMHLPEGFAKELDEEADRSDKEAPNVVTVVLDLKQKAVFDEALRRAKDEIGLARDLKARAVTRMAAAYLESKGEATE